MASYLHDQGKDQHVLGERHSREFHPVLSLTSTAAAGLVLFNGVVKRKSCWLKGITGEFHAVYAVSA